MAKTKNKKKNLSENVNNKKQQNGIKKMNPFEIHVNKEKMKVLGKKMKNDRGLPGVSRAKALQKRKDTLLQEYKQIGKANKITDKRIGERNIEMTEEDRVVARFTAEHLKKHNKKNIFNLADDEVLTHKGQTLSEIEKFDDPKSDDESSDEYSKTGNLDAKFVKEAHFGGGLFKNTGIEGVKSHKDLIDQLIAESKKRKAEKQKIKEQTVELTEKLDTEWKDLLPLVSSTSSRQKDDFIVARNNDDYDKVMRELKFEARGTPSDRLKTEDEIAKEEKEKLEKLEEDRIHRMKGMIDIDQLKKTHKSADDLDDNFEYEPEPNMMLSYDTEGVSNVKLQAELNGKIITQNDKITSADKNEDKKQDEVSADEEEEEEASTEDDNLSDLKEESTDSESDAEDSNVVEETKVAEHEPITDKSESNLQEKIKIDLQQRKNIMEAARKELPYTYKLPNSYEELQSVLQNHNGHYQSVIIERMIKCNHPSLGEDNKEQLGLLFAYLLQHLNDISTDLESKAAIQDSFETFNCLVPSFFDLAQLVKVSAQKCMLEVMKEKQLEFRKHRKTYPDLDVLLYLKLISCLFPTSDFRHDVVTPSIIFIEQLLNKCKVKTKRDVAYGLFLTSLILEYTTLSKRFLPIAINFLGGLIHMAIPKTGVRLVKVLQPFKSTSSILVLTNECDSLDSDDMRLNISDIFDEELDDAFKVKVLHVAVKILWQWCEDLCDLPSRCEIFEPVHRYLEMIPTDDYPAFVADTITSFRNLLEENELDRKLEHLVMAKEKPKALRLYEPRIERVLDVKKHKVQSKEKTERDKLLHKLKQERKGALREIRRDQSFLGRLKIKERIQSDVERKEKVKRLYAEASIQQSELNTMSRTNKRIKR